MSTPMQPDPLPVFEHEQRRRAIASVLRSLVLATAIVVGYFVLPYRSPRTAGSIIGLFLGLVVLSALLTWQIRGVLNSPYPGARAVGALMVTAPLFVTLFAATYYVMSSVSTSSFSEPLSRLDALYFTITIFATVGFGDIVAASGAARAAVVVQMVAGLVLVGFIARVMLSAVQESRNRRRTGPPEVGSPR